VRGGRGLTAAGYARAIDRLGEHEPRHQPALRDHARHRFHEGQLVDIGHVGAWRAIGMLVPDCGGMHARRIGDRGLEKGAVELEQAIAQRGRPLGKEAHAIALREHLVHAFVHARGIAAALAADKESSRPLGDPACDRPVADLALRDEARGPCRVHHEDIEPGDVVGRDHDGALTRARHGTFHVQRHPEQPQQLPRPPLHQVPPLARAGAREDEPEDQRCMQRV